MGIVEAKGKTGLQIRALKFQSSSSTLPRARTCELHRARSRLYRSKILQVNTRWKALAEIYTMHYFAQLLALRSQFYSQNLQNVKCFANFIKFLQNSEKLLKFLKTFAKF